MMFLTVAESSTLVYEPRREHDVQCDPLIHKYTLITLSSSSHKDKHNMYMKNDITSYFTAMTPDIASHPCHSLFPNN